ncbi:APC family permease [Acidiphilium sp.]|uniref:APC family permease n=1 Tax=Acidiphilium sp. TaxID=527 RepID=UPI003D00B3D9
MAEGTGIKLKRDAGIIGLLFASLGGIIGSGWLLGPLTAAKIAGPSAIIAWLIGGVAVLLLSFVYAELATAFPRAGAVIAFPKLSHGNLMATVLSFVVFLGYASVAPAEASAVITYASNYVQGLVDKSGVLTTLGFIVSAALLAVFAVVNLLAIKMVLAINSTLTWWKVAIPVLTIIIFLLFGFHSSNFSAQGFAPGGASGVFSAVATSGIVFSYLGFRQAVELAGESSNPKRNLPIAIIGSVSIGLIVYVGLQISFIGALNPSDIAKGWANVNFKGAFGPFAGLASLIGMGWLAVLLYIDAFISPTGTGIIYFTTTSRVLYATGKEGLIGGNFFAKLSVAGVPLVGVLFTFLVGLLFLVPFPSWQGIVTFISSATVLSYGTGPVVLMTLRKTMPPSQYKRPYLLAGGNLIGSVAFIISNFIIFWSGAPTDNFLFELILGFTVLYVAYEAVAGVGIANLHWRGAWWLAPYFFGLWLLTYLGPKALTSGTGALDQVTDSLLLIVFSIIILFIAINSGTPDPEEAKATILAGEPELFLPAE